MRAPATRKIKIQRPLSPASLPVARRKRAKEAIDSSAKAMLTRTARQMAELQSESAAIALKMSQLREAAGGLMKKYGMDKFVTAHGTHLMVVPRTNTLRSIDPRQYYEVVSESDFFDSCKIEIKAAERHLSALQLADIVTEHKGPKKPAVYEFKAVQASKKSKSTQK